MISEEILGGLKLALSKGETLRQAMMSFYNAGYKKEDIEEAARNLQKEGVEQKERPKEPEKLIKQPIKQISKQKPQKTMQNISSYGAPIKTQIQSSQKIKKGIGAVIERLKNINVPSKQKPVKSISPQKVSNYEKEKPTGKLITLILVFFLLFLLGVLTAVFLFRKELIDLFNNLF